ncbi:MULTISPECIES: response regulator transcription factor [Burkholderia]|uniref:Two-component system response regulator n=2 Tax=Burkholderia cepacia complex TaxID=87882 RepID=A0A6J5IXV6_9BURK|nr:MULTISPECIES: response regulator transcription factor [Burkholderia]EKS9796546.1 response regulator transcription factor [Burkholderia cepacia]EKS9803372.1 response regulator transcription factor [Burkholderia cepacia]EKS9812976.1 response regulator transcription factor [Burkholderia cepacia]EKS9821335.1 response regulator transcription factor [Burkholderia cepacia]EKS9825141.1 response regulator transcription factor [Burkholderia cepacia]
MIVAILEDMVTQAGVVAGWLNKAGYDTEVRHDGDSFIELVRTQRVDVLLLDWDVPGKSGIEVMRWARESFADTLPIIMMTQHDGENDIVFGLNTGADDYLIKPLRERELVARVNAQARKYYPETQRAKVVEVGKFVLDTSSHAATVDGVPVELSQREFDLALMLFESVGRIVSKDMMIKRIWGVVDRKYDATLATYVSKLRTSLGLRPKNGLAITTIYNYGYRLELT